MDVYLGVTLLCAILAICIFMLISRSLSVDTTFANGLPWADLRDEVFKTTRASLRQLISCTQVLQEAYTKFSKKGQPFVVSDFSFQPQILLPQDYIKWLTTQSDTVLSVWPVRSKRRALGAMMSTVDHKTTIAFMDKIVGRFLTRNLDKVQADVSEEMGASVDCAMGMDEKNWHEVNLMQTFKDIGDRTGVRALFGLTLCRDQHFLRVLTHFKTLMGIGILLSGQLPPIIRPIVGLLLILPFRICKARVKKVLTPIVKQRMHEVACEQDDATMRNESQDFLTQSVRVIMKDKEIAHQSAEYVADQFLVLSFATLASTSLVASNLFLDIISSGPSLDAYERLRSEAASVFKSEGDWADPTALKKLVLTDSAIRESIRRSSIQTRGLLRAVVSPDGVTLPNGTHVPQGTWLGVPVQAVHMDGDLYDKPYEYNPFRFAVMRSESNVPSHEKVDATDISDTFLGWSYGRYACPGRWFAVQNLKLMVAYITLNYEIQPIAKRPESIVFGDANVPSMSACIKVRRRRRAQG
ncbi:hypothetical protein HO173_009222 [Letharia columbiana]|uniref:Cytochrome P450 n=1 Tax=Letharia columbiana TaxID=112416 RepID=A0A8H6L220_9LECA|nr:uncharacterized protein HO173_009222 [Letharia columbiana]KAF6232554.1 hypothetical protein HO173_009222 [Letharia columbiana]